MSGRLFSVVVVLALTPARFACGFQIDSVGVSPPHPDTTTPIKLVVSMTAPSAPAYLFAPTTMEFDGNSILVDLFVGSGMLTVITSFESEVDLGLLSNGDYQYTVRLNPEFPVGWGNDKRLVTGVLSVGEPELPGDYNENGLLDAADYTIWRDNLGSPNGLPNDDTVGVDSDDYSRWKTNFGEAAGRGSRASATAAAPEPTSLVLLLLVATGWRVRRGRAG